MLALAGCNSAAQPVQVGYDKYQVAFWGPPDNGPPIAQEFCRTKGFDYAEVSYSYANEIHFFCMHKGETLTSRSAPKVCVGVTNCN